MMKRLLTILATFALLSCNPQEKFVLEQNGDDLFHGISTVVQLNSDTTRVLISDFSFRPEDIDSVSCELPVVRSGNELILTGSTMSSMGCLKLWSGGRAYGIPLRAYNKKRVSFKFPDPEKELTQVQVKGEFNQWNVNMGELVFDDGNWKTSFEVAPGNYQYKFVVDGKEVLDPSNDNQISNGLGGFNSLLEIGEVNTQVQTDLFLDEAMNLIIQAPEGTRFIALNGNVDVSHQLVESGEGMWYLAFPLNSNGRTHLRIYPHAEGRVSPDILIPLADGKPVLDAKELSRKDWRSTVLYFMMVDRFINADSTNDIPTPDPNIHPKAQYKGGDIAGVQRALDNGYFEELGVGSIWLSPITQNPMEAYGKYPEPATTFSAYHGYWPVSSKKVDIRFGTKQELDELIDKAHDKDLNVILDYVANHVHQDHPVIKQNPDWKTDLYLPDGSLNTERWDDQRLTTWFDTFMPTLDLERTEVTEAMTDSAIYWITDSELDGFRHDATKHIPENFWRTLTRKTRTNLPEQRQHFYQVGETYGSRELIASYVSTGMLDAQFDFNLYDDAVGTLAGEEGSFERIAKSMQETFKYYGYHSLMAYITGNQDRARFISYASGEVRFDEDAKYAGWTRKIGNSTPESYNRLAMLHALNLSIPGIPVIYCGDEYGSPGGNDPDNRRMFTTELDDQQAALLEKVKKMIQFRRGSMPLIYGHTEIVRAEQDVFLLKRTYLGEEVWIAFNKSDQEKWIELKGSELGKCLFFSPWVEMDGQQGILLGPMEVEFIKFSR
jgi:cyclomaltodextrinase